MSDPNKQPNKLPTPGGSPNWGVMILMAVIAGILIVAFMFDGALASPGRVISLEQFRQDYRAGKVVMNDPKKFPIEVTMNASSTEGVITAYEYRKAPEYPRQHFYMYFTDSEGIRDLCNSLGITTRIVHGSAHLQGDKITAEQFSRLGTEGRIIITDNSPEIYEMGNKNIIVGE